MNRIILVLLWLTPLLGLAQSYKNQQINAEEAYLYEQICELRESFGMGKIPLSKCLSYVAKEHAEQLETHFKTLTYSWKNCVYKPDEPETYFCMWNKPIELCKFPKRGYEIIYRSTGIAEADGAMAKWKASAASLSILINQDNWSKRSWNSMGVSILGSFAIIWLSEGEDVLGSPTIQP